MPEHKIFNEIKINNETEWWCLKCGAKWKSETPKNCPNGCGDKEKVEKHNTTSKRDRQQFIDNIAKEASLILFNRIGIECIDIDYKKISSDAYSLAKAMWEERNNG